MGTRLSVSVFLLATLATAAGAEARIVSYAPVTDRAASPAHQRRTNRRFVLVESRDPYGFLGGGPGGVPYGHSTGRLVVYDTLGQEEPREVFPPGAEEASFGDVAAHEGRDGQLRILAVTDGALAPGENAGKSWRVLLSADSGRSFVTVALPAGFEPLVWSYEAFLDDFGGPFCRGRDGSVRTGTDETPFVLVVRGSGGAAPDGVVAIGADGSTRLLARVYRNAYGSSYGDPLAGADAEGTRFLLSGSVEHPASMLPVIPPNGLYLAGLDGTFARLLETGKRVPYLEGWVTPDGAAYAEVDWAWEAPVAPLPTARALYLVRDARATLVAASPLASSEASSARRRSLFAIPAAGFSGAWVLLRAPGQPTVLSRHETATGLAEAWRDVTAPEVEALHAGSSGQRLLVQVHRPRPQVDQRVFKDPALAVWEVGQPAPRTYDELFLVEQESKGFVHLDVDALPSGAPFWFDSGLPPVYGAGPPGGGDTGGADVTQEWGVVRGSLAQRLVLAAAAHAPGKGGAFWKTDLLLRNGSAEPVEVSLRLAPGAGGDAVPGEETLTLSPGELRVVRDVLAALFGVGNGHGALFVTPEAGRSVSATSRTYSAEGSGSYGMGLAAVDVFSAATPRFPVTFSAALLGPGFRTNLGVVDPAGRGTEAGLLAASESGPVGRDDVTIASAGGVPSQLDDVASRLGLDAWRTGALALAPLSGEAVPYLVAIDDGTNDPSAFPPDLPSPFVRALPAIVHAGGAGGAQWRSDLFLHNTAGEPRNVTLLAKRWDSAEDEARLTLTLLPQEARVIRDVLRTAFGKTGVARLRFTGMGASMLESLGVRVTSRTYAEAPGGGTYGFALPPLNSFQSAGPGEALEVLLLAGPGTRTNLALVELTAFGDGTTRRVKVEVIGPQGLPLDSFDVNVPVAGGIQVDDLFRARGLPLDLPAAVIRISPSAGTVGAYATVIDQGTNDPSYFAAGLASSW